MNNFIEIAKLIAQLLPTIIEIIKAIESEVNESGKGGEKLSLARELIQIAYESSGDIAESFEEIWPTIQKIIDRLVAFFNRVGVFTKS